jgi:hypothetical protein
MFSDTDFIEESQDSNLHRPTRLDPLKLHLLKKDAVPSQFPNVASYLSSAAPEPRSETATSCSRRDREASRMDEAADVFLQEDEVESLEEMREKLDRSCLPKGIIEVEQDNQLFFLFFGNDSSSGPQVTFSLVISENMTVSMFSRGVKVQLAQIAHISGLGRICKCSQVLNILSFLKAFSESALPRDDTIRHCILLLELLMLTADEDFKRKLCFIAEQLDLATKSRHQRRYSALLLATAVMWDNVSPALYHQIVAEELLSLPGEK